MKPRAGSHRRIREFNLDLGSKLGQKYRVVSRLGSGWEGEVYKIQEIRTGITRAAKLFYPHRNVRNMAARRYAKKLHKLRDCSMVIKYHTEEKLEFGGYPVTMLVSEYVEGDLLSSFLKTMPGGRLHPFEALHLLYSLVLGVEEIHKKREYHGDLHPGNIIVRRVGLSFKVKLIDFFHWEDSGKANRQVDICDLIRLFYDSMGGARFYRRAPQFAKEISCGLRKTIILKRFRDVSQLRKHLENMEW